LPIFITQRGKRVSFRITYPPFPISGIRALVEQPYSCVIKTEGYVTYDGYMIKLIADNYSYWKTMREDHLIYKDIA